MLGKVETVCLVAFDVLATCTALWGAAGGTPLGAAMASDAGALALSGLAALANVLVFILAGLYNSLWRYASISEVLRIGAATLLGSLLGDAVLGLAFGFALMSLRTALLYWAVLLVLCGGARLALRAVWGNQSWRLARKASGALPRTLVVGAGETGSLTIKRMLTGDRDMLGDPVALVDDDPTKRGMRVHGVKVEGTTADVPRLARELGCEQVVFACPSAGFADRQRILSLCMETGLRVQTLPNVRDIPQDGLAKVALRDVEVADLLARDEVELDVGQAAYVSGKCVLVTGGGGSIGSEIARQLLPARPSKVVLFDIYENTAYELYHEIRAAAEAQGTEVGSIGSEIARQLLPARPSKVVLFDIYENTAYELYHEIRAAAEAQGTEVVVEIGSICDEAALRPVFESHRPDVVFHAAAHKHVPLMERNAREAVENNVFGTRRVALLANEFGCSHFVLISTDKAVNPTNVMGATKRMCELEVQSLAAHSKTVFAAVRFGNVLGRHGSVIPLFKRQLKEGGPITLTHRDITRYFMTIPEASRLVIAAGALAKGGEVFILKMGDPVRIYDLACNLVRLSGLKLGRDVEIKVTGLRPGEKLYEELLMDDEDPVETGNDDILVSVAKPLPEEEVVSRLDALRESLAGPNEEIKRALARAVPTYRPQIEG